MSAELSTLMRKTIISRFYHNFQFGFCLQFIHFGANGILLFLFHSICQLSLSHPQWWAIFLPCFTFLVFFILFAMPAFLVSTPSFLCPLDIWYCTLITYGLMKILARSIFLDLILATLPCHFYRMTLLWVKSGNMLSVSNLSFLQFPSHSHRRSYIWYPGLEQRVAELEEFYHLEQAAESCGKSKAVCQQESGNPY